VGAGGIGLGGLVGDETDPLTVLQFAELKSCNLHIIKKAIEDSVNKKPLIRIDNEIMVVPTKTDGE
jgi:hypothetical protein